MRTRISLVPVLLIVAMMLFPLSYVAADDDAKYEVTIEIKWNSVDRAMLHELLADTLKTHGAACKLNISFKKVEASDWVIYTNGIVTGTASRSN